MRKPSSTPCSIDGCNKPSWARGWCVNHYRLWHKYGVPEVQFPRAARPFFENVVLPFAGDDCLIWPFHRNAQGYGRIKLLDDTLGYVHREACIAIHGPPPTPDHQAAHSCGNGREGCCNPRHLRWATRAENVQDMIDHGHSRDREKRRLSLAQVREIKALLPTVPCAQLAPQYGVTVSAIYAIKAGRSWRD